MQALLDAGLISLCTKCLKSKGLCERCLEREGPKFARSSMWLRLIGEQSGDGCPKCGAATRADLPEDGSVWVVCTGWPELCVYTRRIETQAEKRARERYDDKAERRAMALARATATRRASRANELARNQIRVERVA